MGGGHKGSAPDYSTPARALCSSCPRRKALLSRGAATQTLKKTVQNLKVIRIDVEKNLIMIKGAVPGAQGAYLEVSPAVKMMGVK